MMQIGRVFFFQPQLDRLEYIVLVTLESHVNNVTALAETWSRSNRTPTHDKVITAARIHDNAKPQTFHITYNQENDSLGYSFRGHRFRVWHEDPYIEALVRLHHEFSISGITEAQALLHQRGIPADYFSDDLYALEMCDQIAAEVETYALAGVPQHRVFMDFHSRPVEEDEFKVVEIEPFPFESGSEGIRLSISFRKVLIEPTRRRELKREVRKQKRKTRTGEIYSLPDFENWLREQGEIAEEQIKEVLLCPPVM